MTEKMLTATQNINTNEKNQRKITKEPLISKLCCSCVRLLVHRFIFSVLLGKYLCKICCRWKYFSKFCLLGKKMIWVFRSAFEKMILKNTHKKTHQNSPPSLHTTYKKLISDMIRVQYLGHRERVHRSFMKQYNLCDCRYHCRLE